MLTIDRYIIKMFLVNFVILLVVLMSLFVVVDLIVDLDEFLAAGDYHAAQTQSEAVAETYDVPVEPMMELYDQGAPAELYADELGLEVPEARKLLEDLTPSGGQAAWGVIYKIWDYYGPMVLMVYLYLSGLIVVGAMGFTLTSMQRNRELTAVVASGVSLYRIAAPVIVTGIALNALTLPVQEFVIPPLAEKLARSKSQARYDTIDTFAQYLTPDGGGALFSAAVFDPSSETLEEVLILTRDDRGVATARIEAASATWQVEPEGWWLQQAVKRVPDTSERSEPVMQEELFQPSDLSPTVMLARRARLYAGLLSLSELQKMQASAALDDGLRRVITRRIWSRFSLMAINALLLILTLSSFLKLTVTNPMTESAKASLFCLIAWGGGLVALQLQGPWLNAVTAAWLPVIIMLPVSVFRLQGVRT